MKKVMQKDDDEYIRYESYKVQEGESDEFDGGSSEDKANSNAGGDGSANSNFDGDGSANGNNNGNGRSNSDIHLM